MKLSHRLAIAAAATAFHLLASHDASADVLNGEHWSPGYGAWPPAANTWLAGDFIGHKNYDKTPTKDLAMVWSYDNAINIDLHYSRIDEGGPHAGPRAFGLSRGATGDGGWPATAQWVAGDFNHDGVTDIADAFSDANNGIVIDVHVNTGGGYFYRQNAEGDQAGWVEGTFVAGDFDDDGWDDIALVWQESNQITIDMHRNLKSAGAPQFHAERWVTNQGGWIPGCTVLAGSFDNVPGADIAYVFPDSYYGQMLVDIHSSLGSAANGGFSWRGWEGASAYTFQGADLRTMTADFDGNGYTDLGFAWDDAQFGHYPNGLIDLAAWESNGTGFLPYEGTNQPTRLATSQWGWPNGPFVGGDFDGDGYGDAADVFESNGAIYIDVHASDRPPAAHIPIGIFK